MTAVLENPHSSQWLLVLITTGLLAPLCSAVISAVVPSRYSWIISLTAPLMLLVSALASVAVLIESWGSEVLVSWTWFHVGNTVFTAGVYLNSLTHIMIVLVSVISFLIHLYSTGYMAGDEGYRKYFSALGFFTFAMLGLVLAENLLLLFVFWELVGFSSYLLIGHWTELPRVGAAASKAFILNRLGDLGFIAGLMILYQQTGSFQLVSLDTIPSESWLTSASLCFFFGVMGKSAQFPLLTWLPDAMAGPTPVSALIHAATMVAAGIFLLARLHMLFTAESLMVVVAIGSITSVMAAIAALLHYDMKKILAYSTLSQLGFMVMGFGVGATDAAILHLYTHAFFKAGLFLAAGSIIHVLHQAQQGTPHHFDVQDIRNMGGLRNKLPVTFAVFMICGASLAGIPFFSGFQSKESLLNAFVHWEANTVFIPWLVPTIAFFVSFLTAGYTVRMAWMIFFGQSSVSNSLEIRESPFVMRVPMIALALGSGFWMVSLNPLHSSGWMPLPNAPVWLTALSVTWVLLAVWGGYSFFRSWKRTSVEGWQGFFYHTAYIDLLWYRVALTPAKKLGTVVTHIDQRWIDGALHMIAYVHVTLAHLVGWIDKTFVDGCVNGVARIAGAAGAFTRSFQNGRVQVYIFWSAIGILLIALFLFV